MYYLTFDLRAKVKQNVAQYPLDQVTYSAKSLKIAFSNSLRGDTLEIYMKIGCTHAWTNGWMNRQTDGRIELWYEINILLF